MRNSSFKNNIIIRLSSTKTTTTHYTIQNKLKMDALLPKPSKLPNEKPTLKYLAKEESEAPRTSFTNKENGKQKEVLDIIHNGPQAWAENRKKWLQVIFL